MTFDPRIHHRHSIRLKEYDYSTAGIYFLTTCVWDRAEILGKINDFEVRLSPLGHIVQEVWESIPWRYEGLELDAFVIMPNHVQGIVVFPEDGMPGGSRSLLSRVVGWFKATAAQEINRRRGTPHASLWQRGYYEHIVRSDADLERIRTYIEENPGRWGEDEMNAAADKPEGYPFLVPAGPRPV